MSHWRSAARRVAHWTVPPGFRDLLRPIATSGRLTAEERAILEKNRALQNAHAGERCFILATGPSIKTQDLKALQGETCIAVSNFFVHPDYDLIRPRYYCVAPSHPPITEDAWQMWMDEMEAGTDNATMFFGMSDFDRNQRGGRFANRQTFFLRFGMDFRLLPDSGIDLCGPVPGPQSVPIMALMLAVYMGFNEIYLVGCDHDHLLHHDESRHFYSESQHALVRAHYNEWSGSDFGLACRAHDVLWQQYKILHSMARAKAISIVNCTPGGMLDVFPRMPLETVCRESKGGLDGD